MKTAYDKVSYEIIKGDARIDGDGLYSNTDGEIVVRVKIENEFGTFYGEELTLNKGAQEPGESNASSTGKKGCGGSVAAGLLPLMGIAAFVIAKKRRETE